MPKLPFCTGVCCWFSLWTLVVLHRAPQPAELLRRLKSVPQTAKNAQNELTIKMSNIFHPFQQGHFYLFPRGRGRGGTKHRSTFSLRASQTQTLLAFPTRLLQQTGKIFWGCTYLFLKKCPCFTTEEADKSRALNEAQPPAVPPSPWTRSDLTALIQPAAPVTAIRDSESDTARSLARSASLRCRLPPAVRISVEKHHQARPAEQNQGLSPIRSSFCSFHIPDLIFDCALQNSPFLATPSSLLETYE